MIIKDRVEKDEPLNALPEECRTKFKQALKSYLNMIAIPHFSEDKVTEIYRIANDFYREFTVQRANTWLQTVYAIVCTNL